MGTKRFLGSADLIVIFLYGGSVCFIHHFVFPLNFFFQLFASGLLGFSLGVTRPKFKEIALWMSCFALGIVAVAILSEGIKLIGTESLEVGQTGWALTQSFTYAMNLVKPWFFTLPLGYSLHYIL